MQSPHVDQLSFRAATETDISFLLELRRRTMSAHQLASGLEPSESERSERVLARFECARIILLANEPIGLVKVARDGRQWRLIQIQIVPEKQGLGFGGWIIQNLIAEAMEAGASLKLSVLKANPARHLYERLGFCVVNTGHYVYEMQLGA